MNNTYGDISLNTAGAMKAIMLNVAAAQVLTTRFAQSFPLPKNHGKTMTFSRYGSLPPANAPLVEGVTPAGQRVSKEDLQVTLEQYGDLVRLTDVIIDTHTDPVTQIETKRCGKQIAESTELVNISVLKAGTNVMYAGNVASQSLVNSAMSKSDLRLIDRALLKQSAETISEIVGASSKIATEPVGEAFFAMGHTNLKSDIRDVGGFTPVEKYSSSERAIKYEVGKVENIRFALTVNFKPWLAVGVSSANFLTNDGDGTGACDVYPVIIVGKDSYGTTRLQGKEAVTPMVKNPEPIVGDELAQKGFISWKMWHACLILNQLWMMRYEVACRQTPA